MHLLVTVDMRIRPPNLHFRLVGQTEGQVDRNADRKECVMQPPKGKGKGKASHLV